MNKQLKNSISIGLVVIGKDSSASLQKIYRHTNCEKLRKFFTDLIYVDSASSDNSVQIMLQAGFRAFSIENKIGPLSASAGRWAGAKMSFSDYVLFLDSDMVFTSFGNLAARINEIANNTSIAGLTGDTIDYYPGGIQRKRINRVQSGKVTNYFGGYVLLKRNALEEIGNWTPELPVNEELDLNARFWKRGYRIVYFDDLPVQHHTPVASPLSEMLAIYLPLKKDRYGSYGYALRAAFKHGTTRQLLYLAPEPILFAVSLIISGVLLYWGRTIEICIIVLVYEYLLLKRRSYKYNVVVPGLWLTIPIGFFRYKNASIEITEVHY